MNERLQRFYRRTVERTATGLMILDHRGSVGYLNPAARELFREARIGESFAALFEDAERCTAFLTAIAGCREVEASMSFAGVIRSDGRSTRHVEVEAINAFDEPEIDGIVVSLLDATGRQRHERHLIDATTVDPLTGLANRRLFENRVHAALEQGGDGSVAIVDVDLFRKVNEQFGHARGDKVLRTIAARLIASFPSTVTVARWGGDEFALLLPDVAEEIAEQRLTKAHEAMRGPIQASGASISTSVSIGFTRLVGRSFGDAIKECDIALYAAKARGRDRALSFGKNVRKAPDGRGELADTVKRLSFENRVLQSQARTDALTGLANLRALNELTEGVLGTDACAWHRAAVLFIDIDHFGEYNKRYDDSGGDVALTAVARALAVEVGASDLLFRKGGEEFVVVLPELDRDAALVAADRLRAAVVALDIPHAGSTTSTMLTVTVGMAFGVAGASIAALIDRAGGQAMAGKRGGRRNAVHWDLPTRDSGTAERDAA